MKPADPHEFLLRGTCRGPTPWQLSVGELVSPAAAELLRNLFLEPRFTIRHATEPALEAEPSVVSELQARGFDMSTLRLSLFMLGHGKPRRPRVIVPMGNALLLRWGRDRFDEPGTVCGTWAAPACKRDLNMLFSVLAMKTQPTRGKLHDYARFESPLKDLSRLGWDLRTLDFRIRTRPVPEPAPEALPQTN